MFASQKIGMEHRNRFAGWREKTLALPHPEAKAVKTNREDKLHIFLPSRRDIEHGDCVVGEAEQDQIQPQHHP